MTLKVVKRGPELLDGRSFSRRQCCNLSCMNISYIFRNLNLVKQIEEEE